MNKHKHIFIICLAFLTSCYSFTGGSVPDHLNTLYIAPVIDKSSYGNPLYRDILAQQIIDEFRSDNSFEIPDDPGADARLDITITNITDSPVSVSQGALETERRITVSCKGVYYDNVKRKEIFNKTFTAYNNYELANLQENRDEAVRTILSQISNDILLAVVSGW